MEPTVPQGSNEDRLDSLETRGSTGEGRTDALEVGNLEDADRMDAIEERTTEVEDTIYIGKAAKFFLVWACVVIIVGLVAMQIQLIQRASQIDRLEAVVAELETTAEQARDASVKASTDLAEALENARTSPQAEATRRALEQIDRIYRAFCEIEERC